MTAYAEFIKDWNDMRAAFRAASSSEDIANAKMIGAVSAIVPLQADDTSLRKMSQSMRQTVQRLTVEILTQDHAA
jgi:hypothetical protein